MNPHPLLTDVQSINLHHLSAIRLAIEKDDAAACFRFSINMELAQRLRGLHQGQLVSFVSHLGANTLFPPRTDLLSLLSMPVSLLAPMAAARTPRPTLLQDGI